MAKLQVQFYSFADRTREEVEVDVNTAGFNGHSIDAPSSVVRQPAPDQSPAVSSGFDLGAPGPGRGASSRSSTSGSADFAAEASLPSQSADRAYAGQCVSQAREQDLLSLAARIAGRQAIDLSAVQ